MSRHASVHRQASRQYILMTSSPRSLVQPDVVAVPLELLLQLQLPGQQQLQMPSNRLHKALFR